MAQGSHRACLERICLLPFLRMQYCRELRPEPTALRNRLPFRKQGGPYLPWRLQANALIEPRPRRLLMSQLDVRRPECRPNARLFLDEKEGQGLRVEIRQLQEFDDIHPSITGFTFGKKRVRHPQFRGNLSLCEVCLLAGLNEASQKCVVGRLIRRRPRLSGFASFGGCGLLHLPSFGNA